jgi:hypothetical protein
MLTSYFLCYISYAYGLSVTHVKHLLAHVLACGLKHLSLLAHVLNHGLSIHALTSLQATLTLCISCLWFYISDVKYLHAQLVSFDGIRQSHSRLYLSNAHAISLLSVYIRLIHGLMV